MASRRAMPKCAHCRRAIVACITRPLPHDCPGRGKGWVHYGTRSHRCGPQAGTTYAEPERTRDG